jgi:hypothetical protein
MQKLASMELWFFLDFSLCVVNIIEEDLLCLPGCLTWYLQFLVFRRWATRDVAEFSVGLSGQRRLEPLWGLGAVAPVDRQPPPLRDRWPDPAKNNDQSRSESWGPHLET